MIPTRYPIEPPKIRFVTPIFHPNIDNAGRICLDSLKMPPKGAWVPSLNISTLLTTIRLLMAEPNADDGLMPDIVWVVLFFFSSLFTFIDSLFFVIIEQTQLYKTDMKTFIEKAREHTLKNATRKTQAPPVQISATTTTTTTNQTLKEEDASDSSGDDDDSTGSSSDGSSSSGSESESDDDDDDDGEEELAAEKKKKKKKKRPLVSNAALENEAEQDSTESLHKRPRVMTNTTDDVVCL